MDFMRKHNSIFPLLVSLLIILGIGLQGCNEENMLPSIVGGGEKAGVISLTLRSSRQSSRAGVEDDVDGLNENLIKSAILCFYPANNPSDKPALVEYVDGIDKLTNATVEVALDNSVKEALFPIDVDRCSVYVIANPSVGMATVTADMTLTEIKKLSISANFASRNAQPSFTMDGTSENILIFDRGTTSEYASGGVLLQRCASKITLGVLVDPEIEVTNPDGSTSKWEAQTSNIEVLITDGVSRSQLSSMSFLPGEDEDYYSTTRTNPDTDCRARKLELDEGLEYPYQLGNPFYTFPTKWDPTDPSSRQLFMTLMVPWKLEGEENYRTSYYTVPAIQGSEIGRNISYRVNIYVSMLGSFTPDEPFELRDLSYYAVNWGEVSTDVELADTRYLVVDQTAYTVNNLQSMDIPVYTSHETEVTSSTMTYYLYNTTAQGFEQPVEINQTRYDRTVQEGNGKIYDVSFHNATEGDQSNYLSFDHEMVTWTPLKNGGGVATFPQANNTAATDTLNSIRYYKKTDNPAYSRYVTTIKIAHKNHPEFSQTITITQYPQMYITSTQNAYIAGTDMSAQQGNLWVNGHQATSFNDNGSQIWYVTYGLAGSTGGTNVNPNQYVINVTQLSAGEDYVIGDPRVQEYTDLYGWMTWTTGTGWNQTTHYFGEAGAAAPNRAWQSALDMSGTERKLTYYYPTDDNIDKERWIAPRFRVASSYGVCFTNTYDQNKARCASYQELGRPAGRWRMPTVAEMEYIMKLSQQGIIPALFSGTAYMTAQGYTRTTFVDGKLQTPTTKNTSASVRCVYDEWYWGNDTVVKENGIYPFRWGDRERTAVDPTPN